MLIRASVENERARHAVSLSTDGNVHELSVASRASGLGSSVNGGELLCLAMATCYCNDLYREAAMRGVEVVRVNVEAEADFPAPGAPASRLSYRVSVSARAQARDIRDLILHTDSVAEVQNTLRRGAVVELASFEAIPVEAE